MYINDFLFTRTLLYPFKKLSLAKIMSVSMKRTLPPLFKAVLWGSVFKTLPHLLLPFHKVSLLSQQLLLDTLLCSH